MHLLVGLGIVVARDSLRTDIRNRVPVRVSLGKIPIFRLQLRIEAGLFVHVLADLLVYLKLNFRTL